MRDKSNIENEKIEYVPIYQKQLGELLKFAKGNLSMAEFAAKCGVSPTTFSRIVNGTIAKPLEEELIAVIAENSDETTGISYEDLMKANGMVPKSDDTPQRRAAQRRRNESKKRREMVQSIIMRELFDRGYTIGPVFGTPLTETDPTLQKSRFGFNHHIRFALRVAGYEPLYWNFSNVIPPFGELSEDDDMYKKEIHSEVHFLIAMLGDIFLKDIWEPETFKDTRYSIIITNKDIFEDFFKTLEGIKFNNSFSVILLEMNERKVVEERLLPRHDGKVDESLFDPNRTIVFPPSSSVP